MERREAWFVWKAESQERGEWPPTDEALEKHKAELGAEVRLGKPQHPLPGPPPSVPADTHEYSCGPPRHDYADHIVDYKGPKAILDINLPEGEKGSPITGPGWTEVDPEQWSNEYKHKQRMDKAAQN